MFQNLFRASGNYEKVVSAYKSDKAVLKELMTINTMPKYRELSVKYSVSIQEIIQLSAAARAYHTRITQADYVVAVEPLEPREKTGVTFKVTQDEEITYSRNMFSGPEKAMGFTQGATAVAEAMVSMMNITPTSVTPVATNPAVFKTSTPNANNLVGVCDVLEKEKSFTSESAVAVIVNELQNVQSNVPLNVAYIMSAPVDVKMPDNKEKIKFAETNNVPMLPSTAQCVVKEKPSYGPEQSIAVYTRLVSGSHSRSGHIGAYMARHVYGFKVRPDMVRYIDFLSDFRLLEGIKTIHLYTKDIKYAVGLINMYPHISVVMRGKVDMPEKNRLSIMRAETMRKCAGDESVMGVWVKVERYSQPSKTVSVQLHTQSCDKHRLVQMMQYKHYFRYIDPYAMLEDRKYLVSVGSGRAQVIETNVGESDTYSLAWFKVASMMIHRHYLPWHLRAMINFCDWFPLPKKKYDFSISRKVAEAMVIGGFLQFISSGEDSDMDSIYKSLVTQKSGVKQMDTTVVTVYNNSNVLSGVEEEEDEDDNNNTNNNKQKINAASVGDMEL
jgi:hypothetical protein